MCGPCSWRTLLQRKYILRVSSCKDQEYHYRIPDRTYIGTHDHSSGIPALSLRLSMEEKKAPISVYVEATPNPGTLKFVASELLIPNGGALEFEDPDAPAGISPLAEKLFNLPFVDGIFIASNFVAVSKNDVVEWDLVQLELREQIQEMLNSGIEVYKKEGLEEQKEQRKEQVNEADFSEEEKKVADILDEYVRPSVEGDGGAIDLHSFKDGVVKVTLRGACSGCPSSMVTLKDGIENLLKQMVPGVQEVVAEEL